MYQRAFNEIGAYGAARGAAAQTISALIHGVPDDDHPHRETMKALINKRSPLAPSQQHSASDNTARFGGSAAVDHSHISRSHHPPSVSNSTHQHHGAVVPTGAELSSLYRAPTQVPVVVNPPLLSNAGSTTYYPSAQRVPTPPMSTSLAPPPMMSGPFQTTSTGNSAALTGSSMTASFGMGGVGSDSMMRSAPLQPRGSRELQSTVTLPHNPSVSGHRVSSNYQSAKYEYAPVGHNTMGMASTPVHTPVVHAPGLTPMGRDVEARSGSTNAPAILSRRETERLQRQAAKEAQKREKQEEKKEKKKRSCCK